MANDFSRYDVYAVAASPYCYVGTATLKNRFGLRDAEKLKKLETDLSAIRQSDLLEHPILGRFTIHHFCQIHRYLFGDVYSFAGHFRREDIAKGATRFLAHQQIHDKLNILFKELRTEHCLHELSKELFIQRSAYYFAELNYIHPFREGNGRATRELVRQLFARNHYQVDWSAVSPDYLLRAMELSVYDTRELENVLQCCLKPESSFD